MPKRQKTNSRGVTADSYYLARQRCTFSPCAVSQSRTWAVQPGSHRSAGPVLRLKAKGQQGWAKCCSSRKDVFILMRPCGPSQHVLHPQEETVKMALNLVESDRTKGSFTR